MILLRQNWKRLVGTAGNWFLLDITFYANGLFSGTILKLAGVEDDLHTILLWGIYLALAALPGYRSSLLFSLFRFCFIFYLTFLRYWAAVFLIEKLGRKPLQLGISSLCLLLTSPSFRRIYFVRSSLFSYGIIVQLHKAIHSIVFLYVRSYIFCYQYLFCCFLFCFFEFPNTRDLTLLHTCYLRKVSLLK